MNMIYFTMEITTVSSRTREYQNYLTNFCAKFVPLCFAQFAVRSLPKVCAELAKIRIN